MTRGLRSIATDRPAIYGASSVPFGWRTPCIISGKIIGQSIAAIATVLTPSPRLRAIAGDNECTIGCPRHVGAAKIRGLTVQFSLHRRYSRSQRWGERSQRRGLRTRTPRARVHGRTLPILRDKPIFGYSPTTKHGPAFRVQQRRAPPPLVEGGTRLSKTFSPSYQIVATS